MIQNSTALPGNTTNNINLLSSSQATKVAQTPVQTSQDETKLQNTDVSAAYAVEISAKGASLYSQSSSAAASDLTQTTSTSVAATQNSTKSQGAETTSNEADSSAAYSVEISQAGAKLNALESSATSDTDPTKPSAKPPSKPASPPSTSSSATDTTDSSSSTADLSQYSDSQLQEMVSNGKLSASDYNTEVAKRKSSEEKEVAVEKTPTPPPTEPMGTSDISKSA